MHNRIRLLQLIEESKQILFGCSEKELKAKKWEEIADIGKSEGFLPNGTNGKYLRSTIWQNLKKRTANRTLRSVKVDKIDELVHAIIGVNIKIKLVKLKNKIKAVE